MAHEIAQEAVKLLQIIASLQEQLQLKQAECTAMAHVIVESGFVPGIDSACRCGECQQVCQRMADAGFLYKITDRWWEDAEG